MHLDLNNLIADQSLSPSNRLYDVPARRGRGRPKLRSDDEQRADIVAAANALFLENGFFATRMDDIALDRGMSKRTLYRLFPSKLDLFRSMAIRQREAMLDLDAVTRETTLEAGLRAMLRVGIDERADLERQRFFAQLAIDGVEAPELINIVKQQCIEDVRVQLSIRLSSLGKTGRPSLKDPAIAASMLVDMIVSPLLFDQSRGMKEKVQALETCIHYFVNGIA